MGLGQKITKGINTLGRKTENTVNKLGQKTHDVFKKIDKGINRVDNVAGNVIDRGANIGQRIIDKSGHVTNALRAGSNIANAVATNLDNLGVPGGRLAHAATRQLANGATMLDNKRDKLANQIEQARNTAQIEKNNLRKKLEAEKESLQGKVTNFV